LKSDLFPVIAETPRLAALISRAVIAFGPAPLTPFLALRDCEPTLMDIQAAATGKLYALMLRALIKVGAATLRSFLAMGDY
jgi:hypothetical protein